MVGHRASGRTIVAQNRGFCITKVWWHRLVNDRKVQIAKLCLHVHQALFTNWTLIRGSHMLLIALFMYTMATYHEDNPLR
jgi:hypothetical protein